jgi:hypothetical protein
MPLEFTEPIKSADAPVVVTMKQAPLMAIKPTGEEVQVAEVVTPPPANTEVAAAPGPAEAEKTLPHTASPLPLIGLLGLLSLGAAFGIHATAKRLQ